MATTDQDVLTAEWRKEGEEEQPNELLAVHRLIQGSASILPSAVSTAAVQGQAVDAAELFPDDDYAEVPYLSNEAWDMMVESGAPVFFLAVGARSTENGPAFRVVLRPAMNATQAEDESVEAYSCLFSYDPAYRSRNERLAAVAYALQCGAPAVGPFRFTQSEGQNGRQGFKSFVALKPAKSKGRK